MGMINFKNRISNLFSSSRRMSSPRIWVWDWPREGLEFGASFDHLASAPHTFTLGFNDAPVDTAIRPVFKSRSSLKRFKQLHSPPLSACVAVDDLWKSIVEKFVPPDRIQFLPIRLIARGEVCDDLYWMLPFDRVICIDKNKSEITRKLEKPDKTLIFGVRTFVHLPNCLGGLHLARDSQMLSHLLVSEELKNELASTGQDSVFYRPEEVETIDNMSERWKSRGSNKLH